MTGKFIALGSSLSYERQKPLQILREALKTLDHMPINILSQSCWWSSRSYPFAHHPPYVNGVISINTFLTPENLLSRLHEVESYYGRGKRTQKWAPRTLDLDVLDYDGLCIRPPESLDLILPHPRLVKRPFVLFPLMDIAPQWNHPADGGSIEEFLKKIPKKYLDETKFLVEN